MKKVSRSAPLRSAPRPFDPRRDVHFSVKLCASDRHLNKPLQRFLDGFFSLLFRLLLPLHHRHITHYSQITARLVNTMKQNEEETNRTKKKTREEDRPSQGQLVARSSSSFHQIYTSLSCFLAISIRRNRMLHFLCFDAGLQFCFQFFLCLWNDFCVYAIKHIQRRQREYLYKIRNQKFHTRCCVFFRFSRRQKR